METIKAVNVEHQAKDGLLNIKVMPCGFPAMGIEVDLEGMKTERADLWKNTLTRDVQRGYAKEHNAEFNQRTFGIVRAAICRAVDSVETKPYELPSKPAKEAYVVFHGTTSIGSEGEFYDQINNMKVIERAEGEDDAAFRLRLDGGFAIHRDDIIEAYKALRAAGWGTATK